MTIAFLGNFRSTPPSIAIDKALQKQSSAEPNGFAARRRIFQHDLSQRLRLLRRLFQTCSFQLSNDRFANTVICEQKAVQH